MPDLKTYDLFISHAWRYHEDYDRLVTLLNNAPNFKWRNYSVPRHDPKIDPDTEVGFRKLKEELKKANEEYRKGNKNSIHYQKYK